VSESPWRSKDYLWLFPPFVWFAGNQAVADALAKKVAHHLQGQGQRVDNIQVWVCPAPVAKCIPTLPRWEKALFRVLGVKHLRWRTNVSEGRPL